jgi:hypothetical protein
MAAMIVPEFQTFKEEGIIIGRLLAGYGSLESTLSSCVGMAKHDIDTVIKVMFRARGETQRIDVADAIGRPLYRKLGLANEFSEAIADMRFCLKIRNQFAHCQWHDDNTGRLCFVDMEEIAKPDTFIHDLTALTFNYLTLALLKEQEAYFVYVADCLLFLNYEGRRLAGKPSIPARSKPKKVPKPPLYIR